MGSCRLHDTLMRGPLFKNLAHGREALVACVQKQHEELQHTLQSQAAAFQASGRARRDAPSVNQA